MELTCLLKKKKSFVASSVQLRIFVIPTAKAHCQHAIGDDLFIVSLQTVT